MLLSLFVLEINIIQKVYDAKSKSAYLLKVGIDNFFQCFLMNVHFNQYQYIDIEKLNTEISSLTRIIHEKPASTGSRASFLKKHGPQKRPQNKGVALKQKLVKSIIRSWNSSQEVLQLRKKTTPLFSIII